MARETKVAVLFGILFGVTALAQDRGFTGAWVLAPDKSALHEAGTRDIRLTVVDDSSTVNVTQNIRRGENHFKCTSDGRPCENKTSGQDTYTRRLRREKGVLVWQVTMTRAGDSASITYNERWSLSDGGGTLTVHRVYPTGQEILQVFARRQS